MVDTGYLFDGPCKNNFVPFQRPTIRLHSLSISLEEKIRVGDSLALISTIFRHGLIFVIFSIALKLLVASAMPCWSIFWWFLLNNHLVTTYIQWSESGSLYVSIYVDFAPLIFQIGMPEQFGGRFHWIWSFSTYCNHIYLN